jgi:hypothetical protein
VDENVRRIASLCLRVTLALVLGLGKPPERCCGL